MGLKIKGLKKVYKNLTHSKPYKSLLGSHYERKFRKKLGLTGHSLKKLGKKLKDLYSPALVGGSSSINSAGAVIPSSLGRSVTDMY